MGVLEIKSFLEGKVRSLFRIHTLPSVVRTYHFMLRGVDHVGCGGTWKYKGSMALGEPIFLNIKKTCFSNLQNLQYPLSDLPGVVLKRVSDSIKQRSRRVTSDYGGDFLL